MINTSIRQVFFNKRLLICIGTGFSSGLPLYVLISLVPAWLRSEGIDLKAIGLFALIQLPFTWKFLWAPLLDYLVPPFGRRRGWLMISQLALLLTIPLLGSLRPSEQLWSIAALALLVAFFSASQDVVLDAYRRELLADNELGLGNAIHVNAYKIASLIPGSLSLILADHLPWNRVFLITSMFLLVGLVMTLLIAEPTLNNDLPKSFKAAVVEPFQEFVQRKGMLSSGIVLAFIFFYKLGDSMATALATPFYLDIGFSKTEIGLIAKNASLWPSVIGGLLGGFWMMKLGINRALWLFGLVQMLAILGFVWLAVIGHDRFWLAVVISVEALAVGLGTTAFVAFIAHTTHPLYTATQFALFTSLAAVPRTLANAVTGYLVDSLGWIVFFGLCFILAIPGMLLLPRVAPWYQR